MVLIFTSYNTQFLLLKNGVCTTFSSSLQASHSICKCIGDSLLKHDMKMWRNSCWKQQKWRLIWSTPNSSKDPNVGPSRKQRKKNGVEVRSLAHNTLRGRRACWSSGMGLGRVDKFHSLTRACIKPTQSCKLCDSPRRLHPNGFSLPGLSHGSPEIPPKGTPGTLEPHNFASRPRIEVRFEAKL
jgi:hypothetical protein